MFGLDNIFEAVYLTGFVVGSVIRGLYTRRYRQNKIADKHKNRLDILLVSLAGVGLIMPLLYLFTGWLNFADYPLPAVAGWVGTAVFIVALWLLWRSHVALGLNWSAKLEIREGHSLVTAGVYKHIRHPMYAAHWLWGIAQALLLQNWLAGPALLVTFAGLYLVRVRREEQMMLEKFGEEYRSYMNRTSRVIPRLWR